MHRCRVQAHLGGHLTWRPGAVIASNFNKVVQQNSTEVVGCSLGNPGNPMSLTADSTIGVDPMSSSAVVYGPAVALGHHQRPTADQFLSRW